MYLIPEIFPLQLHTNTFLLQKSYIPPPPSQQQQKSLESPRIFSQAD